MSLLSIKLQKLEYNKIVKLAKATGEYDQFLKEVSLSCNNCGAFIVQAPALITMLEHLINGGQVYFLGMTSREESQGS